MSAVVGRPGRVSAGGVLGVIEFGEDHGSAGGLEGGDDEDVLGGSDFWGGMVDDDHGAIGEVSDGLVFVAAAADEGEVDFFADDDGGFEGV